MRLGSHWADLLGSLSLNQRFLEAVGWYYHEGTGASVYMKEPFWYYFEEWNGARRRDD